MTLSLSIPREHAAEVIRVIRAGLVAADVSEPVRHDLTRFCERSEQLLRELNAPPSNVKRVGLDEVMQAIEVVEAAGLVEAANLFRAFVKRCNE
jgi:hypothetical protein